MSYLYVKSGGTATGTGGKYATKKTGSWSSAFSAASEYYGDLRTAFLNAASTDIVFVSDAHDYSQAISSTTEINGPTAICVSDSDLSVSSTGATESYTENGSRALGVYIDYAYGITIQVDGGIVVDIGGKYNYCTLIAPGDNSYSTPRISLLQAWFVKSTINLGSSSTTYLRYLLASLQWNIFENCTFVSSSNASSGIFTEIGNRLVIFSCDFSSADRPIIDSSITYADEDTFVIEGGIFASNSFAEIPVGHHIQPHSIYSCDSSKFIEDHYALGKVESTTSVYRQKGAIISPANSANYSLKITTSSGLYPYNYWPITLANFVVNTKSSKYDVYVEIARDDSGTAIKTNELVAELLYAYTSSVYPFQSLHTTSNLEYYYNPDNNVLPSSDETWVGLTNPTKQYLYMTTVAGTSLSRVVTWTVSLRVMANIGTFYVCPSPKLIKV